jgi:hypothetical protein
MRRTALFLVAALVAACGGSSSERDGLATRVAFEEPLRVGEVTWKVVVTNDTSEDVRLTFPTGQRADVSLRRGDEVVYEWSRGVMFTQSVGHVRIPAGGRRTFTLDEPGLDVDAGSYTLTAIVTASNRRDLRDTREVTVKPL